MTEIDEVTCHLLRCSALFVTTFGLGMRIQSYGKRTAESAKVLGIF
jgi:hypothetical protein